MANSARSFTADQPDFFQQLLDRPTPPTEGVDLDIGAELLGALAGALRRARRRGMSRERLVDKMNARLPKSGRPITLRRLNAWLATSKEAHDIPARYLPALCAALGDHEVLGLIAGALGLALVDARDLDALRLGEVAVARARLGREARALSKALGA